MEVTVNDLYFIIGQQQVEIQVLKAELDKYAKEKEEVDAG